MKKALVLVLILSLGLSLSAQQKQKRSSRSQLEKENAVLRAGLDSLRNIIDSLQQRRYLEDSTMLVLLRGNSDLSDIPGRRTDYSADVSDSLMGEWYSRNRVKDFATGDYNVDSVRFSSNVTDAVMIQRLKSMNAYITLPFNETVKNYMILYSEKMPSKMSRILGLCEYYMPIIEDVLLRYKLPIELKYLAIIESALNPTATSRAGARGIWQFMYSTARAYGLKINSFVDERLDVEKSVDAAARYLRDAYEVFGDWTLAISSYNCGAGNVQKAIRRSGSREFWDIYPYLPRETRGYMPAFVGAMYAITYSKEYGLTPEPIGFPAVTDTFEIRRNLHFKQITEVAGIPMDIIKELNPQYTHDIIPGNEGLCILELPFNWTGAFLAANRDSLYNHKSGELINAQVIKNIKDSGSEVRKAYKVKSGDFLGRIASRNGVTVAQLKKWNHLRSDNLRVGQIIYIYKRGAGPASVPSPATKTAASSSSKSPAAAKTSTSVASSTSSKPASSSGGYVTYTVKSGDTFYSIAKGYPGVSAQNIMDYNKLSASKLRPGMKIKIPKL